MAKVANSSLRYRWWWQKLLEAGLPIPQTVITELYAYARYSPAYYADWKYYLTEIAKDDKLIGVATYILGDGDDLYRNIAGKPMANMVDQALAIDYASIVENVWEAQIPQPSSFLLDMPWLNQNNPVSANDSNSDCGAACLAMLLAEKGEDVTVNDVFRRTGAAPGQSITFAQLKTAAASYGYTLEDRRNQTFEDLYALLNQKIAPILLVNAKFLNQPGKATPYLGAHYVLLVGHTRDGFMVHDPNNLPATIQPDLDGGLGQSESRPGNPANAMLILREGADSDPTPDAEPTGKAWRGLQLNNGDKNTTADWECIMVGKLNAIKLTTDTRIEDLDFAATLVPADHILLRLYADLSDRIVTPQEFASWYTHYLARFAQIGGEYVEVHNEPNLDAEGLGQSGFKEHTFQHGSLQSCRIAPKATDLKYGFPGLSPGGYIQNVRMDEVKFYLTPVGRHAMRLDRRTLLLAG